MAGTDPPADQDPQTQRLDKWLWFTRLLKSRTGAAQLIVDGKVRINRARIVKPSQSVRPGDVLTIALRGKVLIVRVLAAGHRRGPPPEAKQLYEIVETRETGAPPGAAKRPAGAGRPSKRDRRLTDRLTEQE